ncbi:uncharacterized protein LOC122264197 isoform X3 [Penaeus japonicus]|uniref:uncharacterized protein LOC122264197 isoform X3 n=1 Tax=Penaeus japonicus TaxID=27405 RepID=UPI001C716261|nr:uncharacterized protein LOC122264197 isoform X3 [Penaeus japonicus]
MDMAGQEDKYKRRGLQFTSATDSRALRAIQYREGQRSRREDAITQRRQIGSLEDSVDEGRPNRSMNFSILEEKPKKKSLEELGRERYQQLLKWKEDKRKRVEKERKLRKPSFKTGIFQPDTPKYLVSVDEGDLSQTLHKTPGKPTPFKFLVRSSKKSGETPGTSLQKPVRFCTGVTPGVSTYRRLPTFGMGATPNQSLQKDGRQKAEEGSAKPAHRTRAALRAGRKERNELAARKGTVRGRHSKLQSKQMDAEELGVKPLPRTPQALQRPRFSKILTEVAKTRDTQEPSSFAPSDFTFEFNVQRALSLIRSCTESDVNEGHKEPSPPKRRRSRRSSSYSKKEEEAETSQLEERVKEATQALPPAECVSQEESDDAGSTGTYVVGDQHIADTETLKEIGSACSEGDMEEILQEELETGIADKEEEAQGEQKMEGPMSEEAQDQIPSGEEADNSRNMMEVEESKIEEAKALEPEALSEEQGQAMEQEDCASEASEALTLHLSPEKTTRTRRKSKAKTPVRRSRRSVACCGEGVTPTMSRLRPRTPCSRSTRRSLSAHCDSPIERVFTPLRQASARRRSTRRSVGSALKLNNISETPIGDIPRFNLPSEAKAEEEEHEIVEEEEAKEPLESLSEACAEDEVEEDQTENTTETNGAAVAEEKTEFATPIQVAPKKSRATPSSEKSREFATPIQDAAKTSQTTPSEIANDSVVDATPRSRGRRSKVSWMVEGSPWINNARRSSQKRRSGVPPDILGLFDDIPTDGSPLPLHLTPEGMKNKALGASPVGVSGAVCDSPAGPGSASMHEDQTCTNLLALLEPSAAPDHVDSPDIDVWGEDSPAVATASGNDVHCTPVTSKHTAILGTVNQNNMLLTNFASPKLQYPADEMKEGAKQGILADTNASSKSSSGRRKSRRSVMFAVQEDQENLASPHFRFPGTPVRASSRVSMGLFSKVDTNTEALPMEGQDLMGFDSPQSEKKTAATRRKSSRISLLPGMEPLRSPSSREADCAALVTEDLISWDTPLERTKRRRSRRSAVSSLATPRRQSRRVSKAPVL